VPKSREAPLSASIPPPFFHISRIRRARGARDQLVRGAVPGGTRRKGAPGFYDGVPGREGGGGRPESCRRPAVVLGAGPVLSHLVVFFPCRFEGIQAPEVWGCGVNLGGWKGTVEITLAFAHER